jgi:hypothetical protein
MSFPKRGPIRIKKIRDAAKGESCTLNVWGACNGNPETTVWAHSPFADDGKGMSQKADDIFGCFACSDCHDVLDGRQHPACSGWDRYTEFTRAMKKSWRRLIERKILK